MSHVKVDVNIATRCWICGECVPAEMYLTPVHKQWIVFVQPCGNCFQGHPIPLHPMIIEKLDHPSTSGLKHPSTGSYR